jgi:sigma-E factor negative regulatory protein RseB
MSAPGRSEALRVGRLSRWLLCASGLAAGASAFAQPAASPASALAPSAASSASAPKASDNAQQLHAWLMRIHDAATRINYVGTLVNNAGGVVSSARVAHYCEGRNELERIDSLDGELRGMLRVNTETRTIWPRLRVSVIEPVDPRAAFPALVSGSEQHIPEFYELQTQPADRIAGHDADRVLLRARDPRRFDRVLWADRGTGLLLRMDVQVDGRTLESSAFSDVKIGVRPQPETIYGELHQVDNKYRVLRPTVEPANLDSEGWVLRADRVPPGFQVLGCVRRTLSLPVAVSTQASVLQAMFSDGLTPVSLFIERYQPARHTAAGLTVIGATHTLSRRDKDYWLTAVGDVPEETLDQFIGALERKP